MLPLLAIAYVLTAAAGGADAPSSNALEGCVAAPIGDDGWEYVCEEAKARVVDDARKIDPEPYFAGGIAAVQAMAGRPPESTRERSRLGRREAEVLRSSWDDVVDVKALVAMPEGTRMLDCLSRSAAWCGTVLDALAASPWRPGAAKGTIVAEALALRIGDHSPPVPRGCRARTVALGGQIVCPGGFLAAWASMPDEAALARALSEFGEKMVANLPWPEQRRGELDPKELPCRIAGVNATCKQVVLTEGRRRFVGMWGGVTLKGVSTIAFCTSDGEAPVPAPCSTVFEAR